MTTPIESDTLEGGEVLRAGVAGQALVASDEAGSRLHPSGFDPSRVTEVLEDGDGFWRTCAGCHESEDGHDVGYYPHSDVFGCQLGGGCGDCGGIGAVWDNTDYDDYVRWSLEQDRIEPIKEALERIKAAGHSVLSAMDDYNAENGTYLGGAAFFEMGRAIAVADAALARAHTGPAS